MQRLNFIKSLTSQAMRAVELLAGVGSLQLEGTRRRDSFIMSPHCVCHASMSLRRATRHLSIFILSPSILVCWFSARCVCNCRGKKQSQRHWRVEKLGNHFWSFFYCLFFSLQLPARLTASLCSFALFCTKLFCLQTFSTVFSCFSNGWPQRALLLCLAIYVQKGFFNTIKRAAQKIDVAP